MKEIINLLCKKKNDDLLLKKNAIYTFLNPVSYLECRKNKNLFLKFDNIFIDGFILKLAIKLFYREDIPRLSFDMTSLAPYIFNHIHQNKLSLYIVGATDIEIDKTIKIIRNNYPSINIKGYRNGFFISNYDKDRTIKEIIEESPDFLIVGMGVNVQEEFLANVQESGYNGIGFTCGGFISQTSKNSSELITYYPYLINKLNLRFVYRFFKEKHTRKRYLKTLFIFPFIFLKDRFI